MDAVLRNHVIKISKFTVKSSFLGYLQRKLLFGKIGFIYQKSNFNRTHPRYDDFIIITLFLRKRCIDSSLKKINLKILFGRRHPIYDFGPKKFSTASLNWVILASVTRFLNVKGGVAASTSVPQVIFE